MGIAIRQAAAIALIREGKIWLGQRGKTRFLPGFSVFPGGVCDPGETHSQTALRELAEETGLEADLRLIPFDRAITPAYSKHRYDARVYRCELAPHLDPTPDGREFISGRWYTPSEALEMWGRGDLQLAPPTYRQLETAARCLAGSQEWPRAEEAFAKPAPDDEAVLPYAPGLTILPLRTCALPPAAWTNCLLVGHQNLYIVDPGGPDVRYLKQEIERRRADGAALRGVILTHHHPDHTDGYHALGLEHLPLYCHPITAPLLPTDFPPTVPLNDGDEIEIEAGLVAIFHHTPGHAPGHLAIELPHCKAVFAADMISSLSSIVIPSDNGSLVDYLRSLERLRSLDANLVIPAHGPPFGQGSDPFGKAIAHRMMREQQVVRLLSQAPSTVDELTSTLYRGLDSRLVPAATANIKQHLWKLQSEGRADHTGDVWDLDKTKSS